jgi:hypothetical protein
MGSNDDTLRRKHTGAPDNGGRFASHDRSGADCAEIREDPLVTAGRIEALIEDLNDEQGRDALRILRRKFGWTGTMFARQDVEDQLGRSLTSEEWENVRLSRAWDRLQDRMIEDTWARMDDMLDELGIRNDEPTWNSIPLDFPNDTPDRFDQDDTSAWFNGYIVTAKMVDGREVDILVDGERPGTIYGQAVDAEGTVTGVPVEIRLDDIDRIEIP